jgi:hypothetical protein
MPEIGESVATIASTPDSMAAAWDPSQAKAIFRGASWSRLDALTAARTAANYALD